MTVGTRAAEPIGGFGDNFIAASDQIAPGLDEWKLRLGLQTCSQHPTRVTSKRTGVTLAMTGKSVNPLK